MALAIGNKTSANINPGGSTYTTSHTQNTGDGGLLLVALCMLSSSDFSTVTYGGVSMGTPIIEYASQELSQRWAVYALESPLTGSNSIVVTFTANQWNPISFYAVSFTGSSGIGNTNNADTATSPHSQTLNINENSALPDATFTFSDVNHPIDFSHRIHRNFNFLELIRIDVNPNGLIAQLPGNVIKSIIVQLNQDA